MIRAVSLRHYLALMRVRGLIDEDIVRGTTISLTALAEPSLLISSEDYQTVVGNMLTLCGDHGLGLEIGLETEVSHVGTLGYAAISCKTIRQVTDEIWGLYGSTFGIIGEIKISADSVNPQIADVFAPRQSEAVYRFNIEEVLTFFLKNAALVTGVHPPLERLELSYPAPSYSKRYDEIFRCAIKFDAPQTRAIFNSDWFDQPLKTYDAEFNRLCVEHLSQALRQVQSSDSIAMRIRELLTQRQETSFSLNSVALDIGISPRTLERQLQQEGFSYRKLVEEVRLQLAQGWIARGQLAPKEMSHRLGFSDVSTFRRAFKSWTGKTIQEYALKINKHERKHIQI